MKINDKEKKCLTELAPFYNDWEGNCLYFREIAKRTRLTIKEVRRAVRSLARKGLAQYERGLFDNDGMVAGSGYSCTEAGKKLAEELQL